MQDIIAELTWRGLIHQTTEPAPQMAAWLNEKSRTVYAGFDPTADSLHVGSLLPLLMLRRFQQAGHRPIALVGGATGMIGDPSGKSEERNLLSQRAAAAQHGRHAAATAAISWISIRRSNSALLVNNFDWIGPFGYLEFLRDIGKHFPVNVMLAKDSVKGRIDRDSGISYTEFSYMLLQAYDFVYLQQQIRLRAASRRQRSMGQHHGRHRSGPAHARRATLRPHQSAADEKRRRQDGKNRDRAPFGFRPSAPARISFISTGSTSTTPMPANACDFSRNYRAKKSNRSTRPAAPIPASAKASAGWPRN